MSFTSSLDEIVSENSSKLLGIQRGWKRIRLREVCKILNGYPFESSRFTKERGTPLIRIRDILPGATETFYDGEFDPPFLVQPGELLIGMDGDFNCDYWRGQPALLNQRVCKVILDESRYSIRFLRHVLPGYLAAIHAKTHSVTVKHLSSKTVGDIPLPFPSLAEQRRIVAELETQLTRLDASVTALKRVQANLKRYRASVLKAACEGRLVPTEAELARRESRGYESGAELLSRFKFKVSNAVSEPYSPPEGWTWCRSDALFEFITSGSRGWAKHYSDEGALFLRIGNLDHESLRLDLRDVQRVTPPPNAEGTRTRVQPGDLLISITADVGMVAVAPVGIEEAYINQHVALARTVDGINRNYVAWYLSAREGGLKQLLKLQRGATKVGLGLDDIRAVPVPVPPLAEQHRIVAEVERRLSVIEELEATVAANLQRAERLRQSVLQRAFSQPSNKAEQATAIVPQEKITISKSDQNFARLLLSAEIVHHLHGEPTFGRVKHQKVFHACEHIARIPSINGQYQRNAAGPLDSELLYANEAELEHRDWYAKNPREGHGHAYSAMAKAGSHAQHLKVYSSEQLKTIRKLIELMRAWDTQRCEMFSTVYAAWNDLLIWKRQPTDKAILHEILDRWHESKRKISADRWRQEIHWIRQEGLAPTGFGQATCAPEQSLFDD